jgi:hypothetical protein
VFEQTPAPTAFMTSDEVEQMNSNQNLSSNSNQNSNVSSGGNSSTISTTNENKVSPVVFDKSASGLKINNIVVNGFN